MIKALSHISAHGSVRRTACAHTCTLTKYEDYALTASRRSRHHYEEEPVFAMGVGEIGISTFTKGPLGRVLP